MIIFGCPYRVIRHFASDTWFVEPVPTVFGLSFTTVFFAVAGPAFKDENRAWIFATILNEGGWTTPPFVKTDLRSE